MIVFLFILLFLLSENCVAAESVGKTNVVNARFIMEFGSEFLNYHPPIEDMLRHDIVIDQVLMVGKNSY